MNSKDCPNKERNEKECPCPEIDCPRHGICCECINYHRQSSTWPYPACLKITQRD